MIGRLAVQDWLRYQLNSLNPTASGVDETSVETQETRPPIGTSETLLDLAKVPVDWDASSDELVEPQDPLLLNLLNQVEMPDAFHKFSSTEPLALSQAIAINSHDLDRLKTAIQSCQYDLEPTPDSPRLFRTDISKCLGSLLSFSNLTPGRYF